MHEGGLLNRTPDTSDTLDTTDTSPSKQTLDLFRTLSSRFNLEELGTICWELGIKFEDLPAQTLSGKARQLVEKAATLSLTERLQEIVGRERPGVV